MAATGNGNGFRAVLVLTAVVVALGSWSLASTSDHGNRLSDHDARIVSLERQTARLDRALDEIHKTREEMAALREQIRNLSRLLEER